MSSHNQSFSAGLPLRTARLILRPFGATDIADLWREAGRRQVADTTISVPHPFTEELAREWVRQRLAALERREALYLALSHRENRAFLGSICLRAIEADHEQAELGFWVAVDHWNQGYATEAARAMVLHGFEFLGLNRIYAHHMVRNPSSGRVLEKVGFRREGLLRQRVVKWGCYEDVVLHAVLRRDLSPGDPARPGGELEAAAQRPG